MEDVAAGTSPRTVRRARPRLDAAPTLDDRLALILEHAPSLLRTARRYSYCADDAQDAYQRAMEIFLRRAESLEPAGMVGWMRTVVKHEALAVRESRGRVVSGEEVDLDRHEAGRLPTPEDRAESFDRVTRAAEALQRLKPQEVQALVLKAQGLSYHEIAERMNWSYTKVNRCLTEGRRSFLDRFASIESGAECTRWAPLLSLMADGEATPEQLLEVRPHLRRCAGCRATVRGFHQTGARVAALVPVAALPPAGASAAGGGEAVADGVGLLERLQHAVHALVGERATLTAHKIGMTIEGVSTAKLATAAASAAALTGGGAAVVERAGEPAERPARSAAPAVRAPVTRPAGTPATATATATVRAAGPASGRRSVHPSRARARARAPRPAAARNPARRPTSARSRTPAGGDLASREVTGARAANPARAPAPAGVPPSAGAPVPPTAGRAGEFTFERSPPSNGAPPGGTAIPPGSSDATRSPTGSTGASGSASPGEFGP